MFRKFGIGWVVVVVLSLGVSGLAFADEGAPPTASGPRRGGGEVVAVNADNFTVRGRAGREHTVYVDENTELVGPEGQALAFSDLKVGDLVRVEAAPQADGKFYALRLRVLPPRTHYRGAGVVSALDGDALTFVGRRGKVWEFYVDGDTQFSDRGGNTLAYADVQVGMRLRVAAELREDGKWWATQVKLPRPAGQPAPAVDLAP